jgi:hypothetical protein
LHQLDMAAVETLNSSHAENGAVKAPGATRELPIRTVSDKSIPPPGQTLTGKQEHCECSPPRR